MQPSLFSAGRVAFDRSFGRLERLWLDETAWLDFLPDWVEGSQALFEAILNERRWGQRHRLMYGRPMLEPRLTAPWSLESGQPLTPPIVEEMRRALSQRYGVVFDTVGFNYYRDGQDSVAWHGDHIVRAIAEPIIPLVSLGERRKFLLRPKGGGASRAFQLGEGDLLVTGGLTQRTWEHCVPKVAHAGPRISLAFRYGLWRGAYEEKPRPPG